MIRLSISLYIAVLITIVLSVVLVNTLPDKVVSQSVEGYYDSTFSGVFKLLDDRVRNIPVPELDAEVDAIKKHFLFPVDLVDAQSEYFNEEDRSLVKQGRIVAVDIEGADHVFRKSKYNDRIWMLAIELRPYEDSYRTAIGPFELVQDRLQGKDAQQRKEEIDRLAPSFDMPVKLTTLSEIELSAEEQTRLLRGELVIRNPNDNYEQFFMKVRDENEVLSVGPIIYPTMLRVFPYLIFAFMGATLAFGLAVWGRPLIRDLRRLRHASIDFGAGQLDTRIKPSRTNMIGPVIEGFNNMAQQTESLIASQRELTNAVSHELRTPLARLKFGLEMLSSSSDANNQQRYINDMNLDVDELNTLVDELLTYARHENPDNESSNLSLEFVGLSDWLDSQIQRSNRQRLNSPVTYELTGLDIDEHGWIEPRLMSRALSNGIQNAIRHTDSKIHVSLKKQTDHYVIHVDDDGPGVAMELRDKVFEPFTRADISRNRESGGFGLGLAIVAKIAQRHNGSAAIAESPFGGASLQIRWPVALGADQTNDRIADQKSVTG